VEWTKASRGVPGSARRAAVEGSQPLPEPRDADIVLVHGVLAREEDAFAIVAAPPETAGRTPGVAIEATHGCVEPIEWTALDEGVLAVDVRPSSHSKPRRADRRAFVLRPGQWGRLLLNERFALERGWRYRQTTINVGFRVPWRLDLFSATTPAHVVDMRARLW
jgi:hypothetical protein